MAESWKRSAISDAQAVRLNSLCSLSDDELSPAALAVRVPGASAFWPGSAGRCYAWPRRGHSNWVNRYSRRRRVAT
jgi:hypothetical protein